MARCNNKGCNNEATVSLTWETRDTKTLTLSSTSTVSLGKLKATVEAKVCKGCESAVTALLVKNGVTAKSSKLKGAP